MTAKCAHWGTHGAAGLLVVDKGKVLLQLRSQGVREPHTWSIPGGARGKDETPKDAALREAAEETGIDPQAVKIVAHYTHPCACGWEYVTCIATPIGSSTLRGNWESSRLELVPLDRVDALQLHPGLKAAWPALRDIIHAPDTRPNITQVTERLWTGGDRGRTSMATYLAQLEATGITHVIDCRPHVQRDEAYAQKHTPQVGYLLNGQPDNGQKMPDEWFEAGVDFALHAMRDPAAKVLAHSQLGINRGPSMAFAILLATSITPKQARSTIVGARPIARVAYADDATHWWAALTAPVAPRVFYHGGTRGLQVGDFLQSPDRTGAPSKGDGLKYSPPPPFYQRDCVYVTESQWYATTYAAQRLSGSGDVYRVEPVGPTVDATPPFCFGFEETVAQCALIVAVVEKGVTMQNLHLVQQELARRCPHPGTGRSCGRCGAR
jgi:dual specificity phosphatase 3